MEDLERFNLEDYEPLSVHTVMSGVPHLDHTLTRIGDSTFDVTNEDYIESIVVLAVIPALCLVASLLILLIYTCISCCCCRHATRKCLLKTRIFLAILSVLTILATIPGFYGNGRLHRGFERSEKVMKGINAALKNITGESHLIDDEINKEIIPLLDKMEKNYTDVVEEHEEIPPDVVKELKEVIQVMEDVETSLKEFEGDFNEGIQDLDDLDLTEVIDYVDLGEKIRFGVTTGLEVLIFLFVLLPIPALIWRLHFFVRLFNILGVLAFVVMGLFTALYFALGVGGCDLCIDPDGVATKELVKIGIKSSDVEEYIVCDHKGSGIDNIRNQLTEVTKDIAELATIYDELPDFPGKEDLPTLTPLANKLNFTVESIKRMLSLVDCDFLGEKLYGNVREALCVDAIPGLVCMFASSVSCAFLLTVMVWITMYYSDHHIWRSKDERRKKKKGEDPSLHPNSDSDSDSSDDSDDPKEPPAKKVQEMRPETNPAYDGSMDEKEAHWYPSLAGFDAQHNNQQPEPGIPQPDYDQSTMPRQDYGWKPNLNGFDSKTRY